MKVSYNESKFLKVIGILSMTNTLGFISKIALGSGILVQIFAFFFTDP